LMVCASPNIDSAANLIPSYVDRKWFILSPNMTCGCWTHPYVYNMFCVCVHACECTEFCV